MSNVTELRVNGVSVSIDAEAGRSLLSVLRDDLDLTGAKYGCGEAQCGACTVLLDGTPIRSCVTSVGTVGSAQITTIEGLEQNGKLHPVQEAFLETGAMQCAYCTDGMIMSAVGLLKIHPNAATHEIIDFMNGNLCRCGTYGRILSAIEKARDAMKGKTP